MILVWLLLYHHAAFKAARDLRHRLALRFYGGRTGFCYFLDVYGGFRWLIRTCGAFSATPGILLFGMV